MWILTIRSTSKEPYEYALTPGKTMLGRSGDCDIVVPDESASRRHAEIEYDPDQDTVILRDLGSKNGTFANHERLTQPHTMHMGDQIRIGRHVIRVSVRDREDRAEADNAPETEPVTNELLLEAVDEHAVLLYEVARRLNTILDLDSALREVSKLMRVAMGAEKCEVILAQHFDRLGELGFPTSIAHQAIEQRSLVVTPDLSAQADPALGNSALLLRVRAAMCVPVMIDEEVVALIYVYKTDPAGRPFDRADVQLAVAISHQAALAIQRAQLMDKARWLEKLAIFDSLTGLHNRWYFFQLAEREFQRATRFQRPLTAMMLDIDHFKLVNDAYGHAAGDQVLQAVATRCLHNLRGVDVMGRYGGDEFVVLLLESDESRARNVAERLRRSVEQTPVDTERGQVNVTISLGVAALAADCPSLDALLDGADAALYLAKSGGRNRVVIDET